MNQPNDTPKIDCAAAERIALRGALLLEEARIVEDRAITEKRLAAGEGVAEVLTRLAYWEERQLAAIDRLLNRLYTLVPA